MGMNKNGSSQAVPSEVTTAVTGWVARPGYPDTVITNNALVPGGAGSVVVRAQVTLTGGWQSTGGLWVQLVRNGTEIASAEYAAGQLVGVINPLTIAVAEGDQLAVNMVNSHFLYNATVQAGAGTYLSFEPAP
ncbi:hypothetical protein NONI108955_36440 [Nocardia ninae]